MPGHTPNLNLPYPLSTDPISDGDDVIQDLAESIETLWAGPFIPATLINGWTNVGGDGWDPVGYRLFGDNLQLKGSMTNPGALTPGTNDAAFQVPVGFRPVATRFILTAATVSWGLVGVGTNGYLVVQNMESVAGPMTVYLNNVICPLA